MTVPYEIHLAHRNLARNPWLTAAMVGGLALAVLVMVYIPSTMSSFYDDMIDRMIEQNSAHITIWPVEKPVGQMDRALRRKLSGPAVLAFEDRTSPRRHDLTGRHALASQASGVEGVAAVASFVRGNGTVSRGKVNLGITLEGVDFTEYARVLSIAKHFPGRRVPEMGPNDIAIGFRMADKLGVHVGEHVHVATAKARRLMRIKAIFHCGYYDKDLHHAYVPLPTAQRMFRMGNEVSGLAARCGELNAAATVAENLRRSLRQKVRNWRDDNASLLAEIATVKRVTFFINVLVAMVASVGMANVFSIFVLNRQKELAILRAVGSSRFSLRAVLLLEALFIWVVGTIVGFTGSLGVMALEQVYPYQVSEETYGISAYSTNPKPAAFLVAAALAAGMMVASAWWSGRKATRLNPIEVISGR